MCHHYPGFPKETPELTFRLVFFLFFFLRSVANSSQVLNTHDSSTLTDARNGVMAEENKILMCKIGTDTVYNTLKKHTKYAHSVCCRPTLKEVERFRNRFVLEPYERFLYERTFMNEPFI